MKDERRARLLIGLGAVVMLLGILLAVNDDDTGRFLVLGGLALLFIALHRFGRLGPDHGMTT
ncbi:MAG TPA: hypothetical protein VGQ57_12440 [Polyangiaceae bacterium]|nr:hypothetical protein [Polyangiaceae bacterium]